MTIILFTTEDKSIKSGLIMINDDGNIFCHLTEIPEGYKRAFRYLDFRDDKYNEFAELNIKEGEDIIQQVCDMCKCNKFSFVEVDEND